MSAHEQMRWMLFEERFGPLTVQERIDGVIQATTGKPVEWRTQGNSNADLRWLADLKAGSG